MTTTTRLVSATRHLQGIGAVHAMPADDLRPGDVTVWNYGYTATVEAIVRRTAAQVVVRMIADDTGNAHERRMGRARLVGVTAATFAKSKQNPHDAA
jgi:hypothetical protein